jgi:hypothetical protein
VGILLIHTDETAGYPFSVPSPGPTPKEIIHLDQQMPHILSIKVLPHLFFALVGIILYFR